MVPVEDQVPLAAKLRVLAARASAKMYMILADANEREFFM
jgi:hypothetical protein